MMDLLLVVDKMCTSKNDHYDHYCLKLVELYKYKMAWKHSQACQEWPVLAAQPLLRILSVPNLHKIICKCVGPVARSDQRQAGTHRPLVPHSGCVGPAICPELSTASCQLQLSGRGKISHKQP